jgi:protein phosphatase PTC7
MQLDPLFSVSGTKQFERGTQADFLLHVEKDLGPVDRIRIGHDASGLGSGWFLDRLVLLDEPRAGDDPLDRPPQKVDFPYGRWLGESDAGGQSGPPEVLLSAESRETAPPMAPAYMGRLRLKAGVVCFPHPKKVAEGVRAVSGKSLGHAGEDAYCLMESEGFLGVADGVGQWASNGIDAGVFSRKLMVYCQEGVSAARALQQAQQVSAATEFVSEEKKRRGRKPSVAQAQFSSASSPPPTASAAALRAVLERANDRMLIEKVQGSTTVCLLLLQNPAEGTSGSPKLLSCNLGDSGFLIARPPPPGAADPTSPVIVYRSPQQERQWGVPLQLGHHAGSDRPADAQIADHAIMPGDMLVIGTDGLFDNVFDERVAELALKAQAAAKVLGANALKSKLREAALQLATEAFDASARSRGGTTPYSLAASEAMQLIYKGGKPDDITVLVAQLEAEDALP